VFEQFKNYQITIYNISMKTKTLRNLIIISLAVLVIIPACEKDKDIEPIINWIDLAHYSSLVTNAIPFGDTPEGFRVDLYFEGPISGDSINGFMSGIDYYLDRPDGIGEINAFATIVTNDDALITVHITGLVYDDGTIQDEIVKFE